MIAKPAKTAKVTRTAGPTPVAAGNPDADAEKTFFRVRAAGDCGVDTLGTPADPPPASAEGGSEPGLLGRWLTGAVRPARPPRRRTPPPVEPVETHPPLAEAIAAPVIEPDQEAAVPDEAVDSYRSASDLTAEEDPPQSEVVA